MSRERTLQEHRVRVHVRVIYLQSNSFCHFDDTVHNCHNLLLFVCVLFCFGLACFLYTISGVLVDTTGFQPVDFYQLFFPDEAYQLMVDQSNLYGEQVCACVYCMHIIYV